MEKQPTSTLLTIRDNLLSGLDKVAEHMDNGTADVANEKKKENSPKQMGVLTLMLLTKVNGILDERGVAPKW